MKKIPIVTRLSTTIEQREYSAASRRRGMIVIAVYCLIITGIVVWSMFSR